MNPRPPLSPRPSRRALAPRLTLILTLLSSIGPAWALEPLNVTALRDTLDRLIDAHPTARRTTVALRVVDPASGEVLYDRNGDKLLTPASNLKIYTAAAALDLLGPSYTWDTAFRIDPDDQTITVMGSGDPMLRTAELDALFDRVAHQANAAARRLLRETETPPRERSRVAWRLINAIPPAWANLPDKGPGWMWDDEPDYYNMTISPVMLDFNTLKVVVAAQDNAVDRVSVVLSPQTRYPQVVNDARVIAATGDEPIRDITITRQPFTDAIRVSGTIAIDAEPVIETITMHNPDRWAAEVIASRLADRGLLITDARAVDQHPVPRDAPRPGQPGEGDRPKPDPPLITRSGEPLAAILKHFNKVSENAIGEMLLLHLGQRFGDSSRFGTALSWPRGAAAITEWLENTAGLEPGSFRLVDGSGLSRYNLISADSSTRLLDFMLDHEHAGVFIDSLPTYEVALPRDETWSGEPMAGLNAERVFAKPGGMSGVNTISGYLDTLDGRRLVFSLLTNGYIGSSAPSRDLRSKVWAELIRYRP